MSRLAVRAVKFLRAIATPRGRPFAVRRILVAHNLLLGDTILLAPLLKALALQFPEAERFVLARPAYTALFEGRPYGARVVPFDRRDANSQSAVMRSGPYDLALVPDDNRYAWLARAAGARWIQGFAGDRPAWKNWMLDESKAYSDTPRAWADMAAELAGFTTVAPFRVGEWPAPKAESSFDRPASPYAVLHVGASTPLKLWPAERWRALADRLAARGSGIVWSGGRGEEKILESIGMRSGEINLIGALGLGGLWSLLEGANLLVCPDTGIAHLARIVGVPTVALFGPGSATVHGPGEFWKDAPFRVVTEPDYPCRNQAVLFRREIAWVARCGRGFGEALGQCPHPGCMDALGLERVWSAADALLALKR